MKIIEQFKTWKNGTEKNAIYFLLGGNNDNLENQCDFGYTFFDANFLSLQSDRLKMTGTTYDNWTTNEYAYNWAAQILNVTIIGDYIPTTTPEPTSTPLNHIPPTPPS